jgi:hypothetical protein
MAIYTPRHYAVKVIKMTSDVSALKKAVKAGHFCCKGYAEHFGIPAEVLQYELQSVFSEG